MSASGDESRPLTTPDEGGGRRVQAPPLSLRRTQTLTFRRAVNDVDDGDTGGDTVSPFNAQRLAR
jgi:hypothetical protein